MIRLDAATVLLQWSAGGLFFGWYTNRRGIVGPGYGWLLRGIYGLMALGAFVAGLRYGAVPVRDAASLAVVTATAVTWVLSTRRKLDVHWELLAPALGAVGLIAAAADAGSDSGSVPLALARTLVGAAFLGAVTDSMLLGHWYLVQPGLPRGVLNDLVKVVLFLWPFEVLVMVLPTGMFSVLSGTVDDQWNGTLGWMWAACAVATVVLVYVTRLALRERSYSAVMSATGLLYLAILTAFGMDLVARAVLS